MFNNLNNRWSDIVINPKMVKENVVASQAIMLKKQIEKTNIALI